MDSSGLDEGTAEVKADREEAVLHITDQSVMFEKGGRIGGFQRCALAGFPGLEDA